MSADLYVERLFWNGRAGIAKRDGVSVDLRSCPLGKTVAEVDYSPSVRVFQIRESAQGWRDMTTAEITECAALLAKIATAARASIKPTEA